MKLVTFQNAGGPQLAGALLGDGSTLLDLQSAHRARYKSDSPLLASVLAMAEGGAAALDLGYSLLKSPDAGSVRQRSAVKLLAPIPTPPQMRDFMCFEKHLTQAYAALRKAKAKDAPDPEAALREMEAKGMFAIPQVWYERPIFYKPSRFAVVGTDTDVEWPSFSKMMDYELEFGCYIGKPGKNISKDRAREHIFGYTIFNDFSARDEQTKEMPGQLGPGKGKDFDGSNPMGPCVVTADELKDPYNLTMVVRVNGEEWGRGNSGEMNWRFEDVLQHTSRSETLHTGEFFASGTVGNGCGLEHMRFLNPGDTVELEVEHIGILRNRLVAAR